MKGMEGMVGSGAANPIRYTGREMDETGLYYYRARYYSPQMGRFISEDPIGFEGGDVNFYSYVGNRPVNVTDPLGLAAGLGSGGLGLNLNIPSDGCGANVPKVISEIVLQFAGYGTWAIGGLAIYKGIKAVRSLSVIGGWSTIAVLGDMIHGVSSGGGIFGTGAFFWWQGYNIIKEGFSECVCKGQ